MQATQRGRCKHLKLHEQQAQRHTGSDDGVASRHCSYLAASVVLDKGGAVFRCGIPLADADRLHDHGGRGATTEQDSFVAMNKPLLYVAGGIGAIMMLVMVALMFQMTRYMGQMTTQVGAMSADMQQMRNHVGRLSQDVAGIGRSVSNMDPMARDMSGMRRSIERMSGVIDKGGEQIESLNPGNLMQQMLPPGAGGRR